MIKQVYAIYDTKSDVYLLPQFLKTDAEAIRLFSDCVNDPQGNNVSKHPEDYVLFHIGEYDDSKGALLPNECPKNLGVAVEFVSKDAA